MEGFTEEIIEFSKNDEGTWRYAFLTKSMVKLAEMTPCSLRLLINALFDYLTDHPTPLSTFKICQYISFVRHQQPKDAVFSAVVSRQSDIRRIVDHLKASDIDKHLCEASVSLLESILKKAIEKKAETEKMKSRSTIIGTRRVDGSQALLSPSNVKKKYPELFSTSCITLGGKSKLSGPR